MCVRDDGNTQKTPEYVRTMDLNVKNIDKMIRIHGGPYTRQLMNLILERLNYFLKTFSVTVKNIQMNHKTFHIKGRRRLKPLP